MYHSVFKALSTRKRLTHLTEAIKKYHNLNIMTYSRNSKRLINEKKTIKRKNNQLAIRISLTTEPIWFSFTKKDLIISGKVFTVLGELNRPQMTLGA